MAGVGPDACPVGTSAIHDELGCLEASVSLQLAYASSDAAAAPATLGAGSFCSVCAGCDPVTTRISSLPVSTDNGARAVCRAAPSVVDGYARMTFWGVRCRPWSSGWRAFSFPCAKC